MRPALTTVVADDPLQVLSSTAPLLAELAHVRIDQGALWAFAEARHGAPLPTLAEDALHCTALDAEPFLNYLLLLEALNFCFWDEAPRWQVRWRDGLYDGYWALAAALQRAVEADGIPLWDAAWMAGVDAPTMAHLLRGEGRPVPLLELRVAHVRQAGQVLLSRWQGQFARAVEEAGHDAPALALLVVQALPSFRDEAPWQGHTLRFYKRAQILAGDLARMRRGRPEGTLSRLECLTAFADYKVPQVLRGLGILAYAPPLAERLARHETIAAGSREELEIRAATLWACEWIARAMAHLAPERRFSAADVDYLLWSAGQDAPALAPYHRTRTPYY